VIPPAWRDVWISRKPHAHLQATGRDAKGRKQYRYHPLYRAKREENKYERMQLFGKILPRIRRKVSHDLALPGYPKDKVLAAVVRLMDVAHIRVGNEEYARSNHSFGLTTLRNRHVKIAGSSIDLQFRGKSGQVHCIHLDDHRLASIVRRCRDLPGYHLFQYVDDEGNRVAVDSGMVNDYLREVAGEDITAKDFRTWHGTIHAAEELSVAEPPATDTEAKRVVTAAITAVAGYLGNKPATCRKYYVHPAILDSYLAGQLADCMKSAAHASPVRGLTSSERSVMDILATCSRRARKAA
jgi:DNA topoisomerase-1